MSKADKPTHTSIRLSARLRRAVQDVKIQGADSRNEILEALLLMGLQMHQSLEAAKDQTPVDVPHILDLIREQLENYHDRLASMEGDLTVKVDAVVDALEDFEGVKETLIGMICESNVIARLTLKNQYPNDYQRLDTLVAAQIRLFHEQARAMLHTMRVKYGLE